MLILVALFFITITFFSIVTDRLCIFIKGYDEYGDIFNMFDLVHAVPALCICYLFEGILAVKLGSEDEGYEKREHVDRVISFMIWYSFAVISFLFLQKININITIRTIISLSPLCIYGLRVCYEVLGHGTGKTG